MTPSSLRSPIVVRLEAAGLNVDDDRIDRLTAYLDILARWNARMNLTSFDLAKPSDAAIDRLLIEPLRAAAQVPLDAVIAVDIGSGGGSPAVPLKIMRPELQMVLVEVRAKKAAFLREVGRHLGLTAFEVASETFSAFAATTGLKGRVDVVTVRAVRLDEQLWDDISQVLGASGRVLWFGSVGDLTNMCDFSVVDVVGPIVTLQKRGVIPTIPVGP